MVNELDGNTLGIFRLSIVCLLTSMRNGRKFDLNVYTECILLEEEHGSRYTSRTARSADYESLESSFFFFLIFFCLFRNERKNGDARRKCTSSTLDDRSEWSSSWGWFLTRAFETRTNTNDSSGAIVLGSLLRRKNVHWHTHLPFEQNFLWIPSYPKRSNETNKGNTIFIHHCF